MLEKTYGYSIKLKIKTFVQRNEVHHHHNMKKNGCFLLLLLLFWTNLGKAQTPKEFARNNNQFGINLYQAIVKEKGKEENLVFSPLSLSSALTMTYWGARDNTSTQFEKMLGLKNTNNYQEGYANFLKSIEKDKAEANLKIANFILRCRRDYRKYFVSRAIGKSRIVGISA